MITAIPGFAAQYREIRKEDEQLSGGGITTIYRDEAQGKAALIALELFVANPACIYYLYVNDMFILVICILSLT
jgi:hypothetical protein